ncbi:leucine-rich repeat protein, partial [bacterium]|nr:leucine-rich repeat protein [bacterium]
EAAFAGCLRLEEITVPDSVYEIGFRAFADCLSLKRITFRGVCYTDRAAFNQAVRESGCSGTEQIWTL